MGAVYFDSRFERCMEALRGAGGESARVAVRAELVIASLAAAGKGGVSRPVRRSRNGERRIAGCFKYDLGNGYRIVAVRDEDALILLYIGSHDDCDRWLEHNRGLRPELDAEQVPVSPVDRQGEPSSREPDYGPVDDYDAGLTERLSERDLRLLFSGLCGR